MESIAVLLLLTYLEAPQLLHLNNRSLCSATRLSTQQTRFASVGDPRSADMEQKCPAYWLLLISGQLAWPCPCHHSSHGTTAAASHSHSARAGLRSHSCNYIRQGKDFTTLSLELGMQFLFQTARMNLKQQSLPRGYGSVCYQYLPVLTS